MSNETGKHETDKKELTEKEKGIYIERNILKYFKDRIGDKYKLELEEENERKRNIQENI
jgi:hypothetical protein